jgi:hypothetical protein
VGFAVAAAFQAATAEVKDKCRLAKLCQKFSIMLYRMLVSHKAVEDDYGGKDNCTFPKYMTAYGKVATAACEGHA